MPEIERKVLERPEIINKNILKKIEQAIRSIDLSSKDYEVSLENIHYNPDHKHTVKEMKTAVLKGGTLAAPIQATVVVKNKKTGEVTDKKTMNIIKVPLLTDHFSFVIDGTEYTVPNQLRIREGVYTRFRENKVPEATFNLAKGKNFDITLDPEKLTYNIEFKNGGKLPLFPILEHLGVTKDKLEKEFGKDITAVNLKLTEKEKENALNKFRTITGSDNIKEYLSKTVLDPHTTEITLGKPHTNVTHETLLDASKKLLKVVKGDVEPDNRDELVFKRFILPEDILQEAVEKRYKPLVNKLHVKLRNTGGKIPSGWNLNKTLISFLTTAQLSQNPEQINPVEFIDRMSKVTYLGEGGISSSRAVPLESRNVQDSYAGFLDLIRTSESQNAGMDLRTTLDVVKGKDGYLYAKFKNVKTGEIERLSPKDVRNKVIAFSEYESFKDKKEIPGIKNGKFTKVNRDEVEYILPSGISLFSMVTNAVPFLNNNAGNRVNMASKFLTQALSLKEREAPLITPAIPVREGDKKYKPSSLILENIVAPLAPVDGVVHKVKEDEIIIKGKDGKKHTVNIYKDYPLSRKTMITHIPLVKEGDIVTKGMVLADSNYSKNRNMALGVHLNTAYIPYKGLNHEDGIVISESAAKKLTSIHMYKHRHEITPKHTLNKKAFHSFYPTEFTQEQLSKLDESGIIKPGMKLKKGDPLIAALVEREPTEEEKMLGKLHKSFLKPRFKYTETWKKDVEGEVVDVHKHGRNLIVTVKTEEPAVVGDKLAILHGGKGVITKILPDHQMPKIAGEPAEMLLTPLGILSRVNPGQLYELALNKLAKKTGKSILIKNFNDKDVWKQIKSVLDKYGISEEEVITFPENDKKIKATAGPMYTLKLFKQTDTNYSARDFGTYDTDERPVKGGEKGAKSIGMLDLHAYISHGAEGNLLEASAYKGTKNDEFWNALLMGRAIPAPKPSFTTEKFLNMLRAGGINYVKEKDGIRLLPMTDKDTLKISNGKITEPKKIDQKFKPEKGGIFDPTILGGLNGDRWGYAELPTHVVNPIYEKAVQSLIGKDAELFGKETYDKLKNIKVEEEIEKTKKEIEKATRIKDRDDLRKKLKTLFNLKKMGFDNPAEAYMIKHVPILPPKYRPVNISNDGTVLSHDSNYLYTDLMLINKELHNLKTKDKIPDEALKDSYEKLYNTVKALYGVAEPTTYEARNKNIRGFLSFVTGGNKQPKESYFQAKVIKKTQDLSGRATAVTDATYGLNEIGIPKDMGLTIYKPFIIRELTKRGHRLSDAIKMIEEKDSKALEALEHVSKDRPVIANRAPTLWKHNIMAFKPRFVEGKSIIANGLILPGFNLDFDGDTLQVYVPATEEARREAIEKMMPNKIPFSVQDRSLMFYPRQEALMGLFTETAKKKK